MTLNPAHCQAVRTLAGLDADQRASLARSAGVRLEELDGLTRAKQRGELPLITALSPNEFAADYPDIWDLIEDGARYRVHLGQPMGT